MSCYEYQQHQRQHGDGGNDQAEHKAIDGGSSNAHGQPNAPYARK